MPLYYILEEGYVATSLFNFSLSYSLFTVHSCQNQTKNERNIIFRGHVFLRFAYGKLYNGKSLIYTAVTQDKSGWL